MKIPMTAEMQSVIIAVQAYYKFIYSDMIVKHLSIADNDLYAATELYYHALPIPKEMKHNRPCFDAILHYPIDRTLDTECDDLPKKFLFGY